MPAEEQAEQQAEEQDKKDTEQKKTTDTDKSKAAVSTEKTQAIINAPVNAFQQQQQDIKYYLNQEEISSLLVGPDDYLIATNKYTTRVNKGVMVLIPDWHQSIASPNALQQLGEDLPPKGWTTITLHPPHKPESYPSQAFTEQERAAENIKILTTYRLKFAEILKALLNQAKTYPGVIIVVAEGNHSAVVLDTYQQGLVGEPSALIMLSSYMPTIPENEKIAHQLAVTDYPILDLYLKRDHRFAIENAKMRKNSAKREMKVFYRQRQLSNRVTGYYPKNTLTKEIISWLSTIGW